MAWDSLRSIVGCEDTRALIFDMCSGKVIRTMPPNPGINDKNYLHVVL